MSSSSESLNSTTLLEDGLWNTKGVIDNEDGAGLKRSLIKGLFGISEDRLVEALTSDFNHYFKIYANECHGQFFEDQPFNLPLNTHSDFIKVITLLFKNINKNRADARKSLLNEPDLFSTDPTGESEGEGEPTTPPDGATIHFTIAFCLRVWLMMEIRDVSDCTVITGTTKSSWDNDFDSLRSFIDCTLCPKPKWASASTIARPIQKFFTAKKLATTKDLNLKIFPTYNLSDHLKYDKKKRELNIFPYVSFLHAHYCGEFSSVLGQDFLKETLMTLLLLYRDQITEKSTAQDWEIENILKNKFLDGYAGGKDIFDTDIFDYKYYGARLEYLNEALVQVIHPLETPGGIMRPPFRRQKHDETIPRRNIELQSGTQLSIIGDRSLRNNTSNGDAISLKKFQIEGPPKPLTLARTINTWSPALLKWGHHSSLRRHKQKCPRHDASIEMKYFDPCGYLLVAIFDNHSSAQEKCIYFKREDISEQDLFSEIKKSYEELYGWRRLVSLKSLSGFNLFLCEGSNFETHSRPPASSLNPEADIALAQLFKVYRRKKTWLGPSPGVRTAWAVWIDKNLNGSSRDPRDGRGLGLELVIGWSGTRIVVLTLSLVIMSLIFGVVYGPLVEDIQTAWTIASYIITATGVLAAILAILWNRDSPGTSKTPRSSQETPQDYNLDLEAAKPLLLGSDSSNVRDITSSSGVGDFREGSIASLQRAIEDLSKAVTTLQQNQRQGSS